MKKINKHLFIIDSVDHSGKTKLCEHLIEKYRFNYYHCGVMSNITEYHQNVLDLVFKDIKNTNGNWVIDRMHLSEEVYGNIFRNGPEYDWKEWNQKIVDKCKELDITYKIIMCLTPRDIVIKGHAERNANGDEMFDTVAPVYDAYAKLYEENKNFIDFYKYDFTFDPDYTKLDIYLENL